MSNPYAPPETPLRTSPPPQGIQWRLIPSAFLILFGGLLALTSALGLAINLARSPDILTVLRSTRTLGALLIGTAGGLWITSGAFFWKRKWWRAIFILALGYASGVLGASFIHP